MRAELMIEFRDILAGKNRDLPHMIISNLRRGSQIFSIDMGESNMDRLYGIMQKQNVEPSIEELNKQFTEWTHSFHNKRANPGEKFEIWNFEMDWQKFNYGARCNIEVKYLKKAPAQNSLKKMPTSA
jgi:hypothetical protein